METERNPLFLDNDSDDNDDGISLTKYWDQLNHRSMSPPITEEFNCSSLLDEWQEKRVCIEEELQHNLVTDDPETKDMVIEVEEEVDKEASAETPSDAKSSIFYHKTSTGDEEVLRDRTMSDILSILCMDHGIRHVEVPTDTGSTITAKQKFTIEDFKNSIRLGDSDDEDLDMEDIVLDLLNPAGGTWDNIEFVCSWAALTAVRPMKLLEYFSDPDEVATWFWELSKRGSTLYNRMIYSEHVRGWSPLMLLLLLEAGFMTECTEFLQSKFDVYVRPYLSVQISAEDFLSTNLLMSMKFAYNSVEYLQILSKMGVVPFPTRAPHTMDLCDLSMSLTCISKAWRTWSFWYNYTLVTDKEHTGAGQQRYMYSDDPLHDTTGYQVDTFSSTGRHIIEHTYWHIRLLEKYLYWLRRRLTDIYSHPSMDPKNPKVKEHLFYITGMFGLFHTFINLYLILYSEQRDGVPGTITQFISTAYECPKPSHLEHAKVMTRETAIRITTETLPNTQGLGKGIVHECLEISKQGAICDDITALVQKLILPVNTNLLYHSRSGGGGVNTKMACRETLPRASQTIQREFMDIVGGSDKKMRDGLSSDLEWCVDLSLQIQGIDSCIGQFSPTFKWSEKYIIYDWDLPCVMEDLRKWPTIDDNGCVDKLGDLLNDIDEESPTSNIAFRCPDGECRDIVIVLLGPMAIVCGYGHTFITPSITEAFCAWAALKDAHEGWMTDFYIDYLGEDKNIHRKLAVCNLESGVQYILQSKFRDTSTFQNDIDESLLNRLSHRMGDNRRDNTKGLSVADVQGTSVKEQGRSADGNKSVFF